MTIRNARREDKKHILSLQDELLTEVARVKKEKPTHQKVEDVGSQLFDKTFDHETIKYFVAEENGEIVGLATLVVYPLVRRGQYRAKLEELVVTGKMRGKGVGAQLLQTVIQYCKDNKMPTLVLNSEIDLTRAHKFYEKHGARYTEKMFRFDL